jgi:hypothetical protein
MRRERFAESRTDMLFLALRLRLSQLTMAWGNAATCGERIFWRLGPIGRSKAIFSRGTDASDGMNRTRQNTYRRRNTEPFWHFCSNCIYWPLQNFEELIEPDDAPEGAICARCVELLGQGKCQNVSHSGDA